MTTGNTNKQIRLFEHGDWIAPRERESEINRVLWRAHVGPRQASRNTVASVLPRSKVGLQQRRRLERGNMRTQAVVEGEEEGLVRRMSHHCSSLHKSVIRTGQGRVRERESSSTAATGFGFLQQSFLSFGLIFSPLFLSAGVKARRDIFCLLAGAEGGREERRGERREERGERRGSGIARVFRRLANSEAVWSTDHCTILWPG
ncbi:hypothetical protein BHE74_00014243 [Ensete ventricosum]|nr:hypothetical protein BHE74_00014243 [Ensete ventricosum]